MKKKTRTPHLDHEGRSAGDDFRWNLREGTIFDGHDLQVIAVGQFEGQAVEIRIVVQVDVFQFV